MPDQTFMSLHDDKFGEGPDLAFPTMSTCAAIICVLDDRLFGVHKTARWNPDHGRLFTLAQAALAGRRVSAVYVAGWNARDRAFQDIGQIQDALGIGRPPTYVFDYKNTSQSLPRKSREQGNPTQMAFRAGLFTKKTSDLCTFAFFNGATQAPTIGIKRSTKVHVESDDTVFQMLLGAHGALNARFYGYDEHIATPSEHLHMLHFTRI